MFKVVPTIYYQLFTPFVAFANFVFPVCYTLMSRKTTELYVKVFQKVVQLVPQFAPTCAMADFEEASVAGFQHVYTPTLPSVLVPLYGSNAKLTIPALWCRVTMKVAGTDFARLDNVRP